MPPYSQILPGTERSALHVVENRLLLPVVVFLPTVIGKRSEVIKYKTVLFCIKSRRAVRIARAPCCAVRVDELAKCGIIRGLLLSSRSNKGEQSSRKSERDIQYPAPSFAASSVYILCLQVRLRPPQLDLTRGARKPVTLSRIPYGVSDDFARGT